MKYYALYDDDGKLLTFGMTSAKTVKGEITEAEYQALEDAFYDNLTWKATYSFRPCGTTPIKVFEQAAAAFKAG